MEKLLALFAFFAPLVSDAKILGVFDTQTAANLFFTKPAPFAANFPASFVWPEHTLVAGFESENCENQIVLVATYQPDYGYIIGYRCHNEVVECGIVNTIPDAAANLVEMLRVCRIFD